MEFKEIAAISGKGGLFKITKPTRTGVIVESIDDKNTRMVASATNRISILKEISVYTTTKDGSIPLEEVLRKIYEEFQDDPGVTTNSEPEELKSFIKFIVPDYDPSRVYVSDVKKILNWYNILVKYAPEVFEQREETVEEEAPAEETAEKEETVDKKEITSKSGNETKSKSKKL
ncbi:MAG: DUF5606 domain-containing protein [Bacteroidota bacterium]|jgi:hypothetical protein|nr:DUF5606 domain-containing protein [Bacteroidota bacterium]